MSWKVWERKKTISAAWSFQKNIVAAVCLSVCIRTFELCYLMLSKKWKKSHSIFFEKRGRREWEERRNNLQMICCIAIVIICQNARLLTFSNSVGWGEEKQNRKNQPTTYVLNRLRIGNLPILAPFGVRPVDTFIYPFLVIDEVNGTMWLVVLSTF